MLAVGLVITAEKRVIYLVIVQKLRQCVIIATKLATFLATVPSPEQKNLVTSAVKLVTFPAIAIVAQEEMAVVEVAVEEAAQNATNVAK